MLNLIQDELSIQRLDSMNIGNSSGNAFCSQQFSSFQSFGNHHTAGKKHNITTGAQQLGAAPFKLLISLIQLRSSQTTQTNIAGTDMLGCSLDSPFGADPVRGDQHAHTGQSTHQSNIFHCLMSTSILTNGDTGVCSSNLYVLLAVAYAVADLLKSATGSKHGKGADKWYFTH